MAADPGIPPAAETLAAIRLLVFDFDGVFTDNAVWVDETGTESVRCFRSDGVWLHRLAATGVHLAVLSSEPNPVVLKRCEKLRLRCEHGCKDKAEGIAQLADEYGVPLTQTAFVGNDINDEPALRTVGLPILVADAHRSVVPLAKWIIQTPGGHGAVREICDVICEAREARENQT